MYGDRILIKVRKLHIVIVDSLTRGETRYVMYKYDVTVLKHNILNSEHRYGKRKLSGGAPDFLHYFQSSLSLATT